MSRLLMALSVVAVSSGIASQALAQTSQPPTARPIASCSSGLRGGGPSCASDRRLLISLTRKGAGAPVDLIDVVHTGALASGVVALSADISTPADSAIFGVIDVSRDAEGNYRIEQGIAGSSVNDPASCHGEATGRLSDLGFGAFLALQTTQLVRCIQDVRAHSKGS